MPAVFSRSYYEAILEHIQNNSSSSSSSSSSSGGGGGTGISGLSLPQLRRMLAPFVLRRIKGDVLNQLPPKLVEVVPLACMQRQRELYDAILRDFLSRRGAREAAAAAAAAGTEGEVELNLLPREATNLFTSLRKAANHPLLLRALYRDPAVLGLIAHVAATHEHFGNQCSLAQVQAEMETLSDYDINQICHLYSGQLGEHCLEEERLYDSPKMMYLRDNLPMLVGQGHSVLIFSQWTRLLDLIGIMLEQANLPFVRLDGSTPISERQDLVDEFNQGGDVKVFLLSTKAGGLGINLTRADYVIFHDLDMNPEADRQAEDRAHRIGQTRPVTVIKLYTEGTVDHSIFDMGTRKTALTTAVLSEQMAAVGDEEDEEDNQGKEKGKGKGKGTSALKRSPARGAAEVGMIGRILASALSNASTAAAAPTSANGWVK
jgi:SWI/SNF-related matrix-associated actin-dependent regulator 1 of chromatin subfamily A